MRKRSRVILNYPPVSSVWHLPLGIALLASYLRERGFDVVQRYSHIGAIENLLLQDGGVEARDALKVVRNSDNSTHDWYRARMSLERVSSRTTTEEEFLIQRNNVLYVPVHYDGTIESLLTTLDHRQANVWFRYFTDVEVPLLCSFRPHLYGISIADERQLIPGCILASVIKEALPSCLVVMGGNFWSRVVEAFDRPAFKRCFDFFDAIVYREGFTPIREILETSGFQNISGVVWRDGARVRVNSPTLNPILFETLPTPQFDGGCRQWSSDDVFPLYTMSNCPMACSFCSIAAGSDSFLARPRSMSPRRIVEHMISLQGKRFDILDETLSFGRQMQIGRELRRFGYSATWQCYMTTTDQFLDPGKCRKLYEAGCRCVQLGLETLSDESLVSQHKEWNHPTYYGDMLKNLRDAGIQTHIFIIVGLPGESLTNSLRWVPFLERNGENILTIKHSRYRVARSSPDDKDKAHERFISVFPDPNSLRLNHRFSYNRIGAQAGHSSKRVDALRLILEQACRRHWAYALTSSIPWWINRGRYSWEEFRKMAEGFQAESSPRGILTALTKARGFIKDESSLDRPLDSYEHLLRDIERRVV